MIFDAKETGKPYLPFDKIQGHQAQDLEHALKYGAFSFLAVRCKTGEYLLPWASIREVYFAWAKGASQASVVVEDVGYRMDRAGWLNAYYYVRGKG